MDKEIEQFLRDFEEALQARSLAEASSKRAKRARRAAESLVRGLSEEEEPVELFTDLERRAKGIERKLVAMSEQKVDLKPFVLKAQAMLSLDDILPPALIQNVQAILERANATEVGSGRRRVPLPFDLGAECLDCQDLLVGGRRGSPRWGHVRTFITRHDEKQHEGFSAQERLNLRAASSQLEAGAEEVMVKRYRIFRTGT